MTDVIAATPPTAATSRVQHYDLIELLFFAYRDFVGEADAVLERFGFGRAHHRVLHFVNRNPGLTVADLLGILGITKQSLGRVLRDLVDEGYVEARAGRTDRRQRLLFATAKGADLAGELADLQSSRIDRAFAGCGPDARASAASFLYGLIDEDNLGDVQGLISGLHPARGG
jgi:DNA-binding MarR family transcriptional regulator